MLAGSKSRCQSWLLLLALGVALVLACGRASADTKSLVSGYAPARAVGMRNVAALTDGVQAPRGGGWNTELSAIFGGRSAFVEYDLGAQKTIDSVYLQGDNNDTYAVAISADGQRYREIWAAGPDEKPGLRARFTSNLNASGRYIKVSARGGDGSYALTELQLFASRPKAFPPKVPTREGTVAPARVRNALIMFGFALAVFLVLAQGGMRWFWVAGLALIPLTAAWSLGSAIRTGWPLEGRELSLLRSMVAAVALFALLRERLFPKRFPLHRGALLGALIVTAGLSAASFYNLGRPQFWNAKEGGPEFVHQLDMRVYYPFAKYFDELGYDGVYHASILAYVEQVPGATLESLANVEIRNMRTHELQKVADVEDEIRAVSKRFTPERWESLKHDMRYFIDTMGEKHYLATHSDHGANATPLWVAFARPWFVWIGAAETSLVIGGLLDPVLLAIMFAAVGFTFGVRQMLLGILVFGATNLYMFGTNWAGATLRHDWIAYMGLGACALRRERWILAGVFLALAVMIRAFPGMALAGVGLPCLVLFAEAWRKERRFPNLRAHLAEHRDAVRVTVAAVVCMLFCVVVTGFIFSFGSWVDWWKKVSLLDAGIGTNDVSLRALVAFGTDEPAQRALRARMPLYIALFALYCGAAAFAARRGRLDQAALLALPLIVVVFNPANYYAHFIAILPLLGSDFTRARPNGRPEIGSKISDLAVSGPLLALCVAEYWTVLDPDYGRHFQYETVLTFAAFGWLFHNVLRATYPELAKNEPLAAP